MIAITARGESCFLRLADFLFLPANDIKDTFFKEDTIINDSFVDILGIPKNSLKEIESTFASLSVSNEDKDNLAQTVKFLKRLQETSLDEKLLDIRNDLNNLYHIAHRYGAKAGEQKHIFIYPLKRDINNTYGLVTLGSIQDEKIKQLAKNLPQRDRKALTQILQERLPAFGFEKPSEETMERVPTEELALWALLLRISEFGDWRRSAFADSIFNLMQSGRSKDFFDPSHDNSYYRHIFSASGRPFDKRMADITVVLETAAKLRRNNIDNGVKGTVFDLYDLEPHLIILMDLQRVFFPFRRWFGRRRPIENN